MTSSKSTVSHHGTAVTIPRPFEAYGGSEPYVFVSYSHTDAEEVYNELALLRQKGCRIWYDEGITPGVPNFKAMIAERIVGCSYTLGYLSPDAVGSEWVQKEIGLAIDESKQLLTVHLRQTKLPAALKIDLFAAQAIMKYEKQEAEYLTELLKTIPESCFETCIIEPPLELDFKNEIEFRIGKAPKWSRELADELTQFGEGLGLEPERAQSVLARTLKELGIDVDYDSRLEQIRKLAATLVATGEITPERRRMLTNRGEALRIPPAHWESVVQEEAVLRAGELIGTGATADASRLLVSAVGEVVPQIAEIRSLLEKLEQERKPAAAPTAAEPAQSPAARAAALPAVSAPAEAAETVAVPERTERAATSTLEGGLTIRWIRIPAGLFLRGCPEEFIRYVESEYQVGADVLRTYPVRTEPLDEFWISRTPVTNELYHAYIKATGHRFPAGWRGTTPPYPRTEGDRPVTGVTWQDSVDFAQWLGARLPTRAETEKACRGTDGQLYPWGNQFDQTRCNTSEAGIGALTPVERYPEGASPYGVLDLVGNAWEWVADEKERMRMTVGASYERVGEVYGAGFFDLSRAPESSAKDLGFRLACRDPGELKAAGLTFDDAG
ncbi:MAG TPA: SUMF1/EgtB/PvdO family nonheme iron enzyme [Gemmatimonadales bacterium]|nr:SUMF1/EgtB/PvdO family nonheme iron enzyme [Gemmatimonadales bacterium]